MRDFSRFGGRARSRGLPLSKKQLRAIERLLRRFPMPACAGLYVIAKGERKYVGQSKNCQKRYRSHLIDARKYCHVNFHLQEILLADSGWTISILETAPSTLSENGLKHWLNGREAFWIDFLCADLNIEPANAPALHLGSADLGTRIEREKASVEQLDESIKGMDIEILEIDQALAELRVQLITIRSRITEYLRRSNILSLVDLVLYRLFFVPRPEYEQYRRDAAEVLRLENDIGAFSQTLETKQRIQDRALRRRTYLKSFLSAATEFLEP